MRKAWFVLAGGGTLLVVGFQNCAKGKEDRLQPLCIAKSDHEKKNYSCTRSPDPETSTCPATDPTTGEVIILVYSSSPPDSSGCAMPL